jgi:hypothetical protein
LKLISFVPILAILAILAKFQCDVAGSGFSFLVYTLNRCAVSYNLTLQEGEKQGSRETKEYPFFHTCDLLCSFFGRVGGGGEE